MSVLVEGKLGKDGSVAEADSSGMECLRSKVEAEEKRERVESCRCDEEPLVVLLRWEGKKSLVKALAILCKSEQ